MPVDLPGGDQHEIIGGPAKGREDRAGPADSMEVGMRQNVLAAGAGLRVYPEAAEVSSPTGPIWSDACTR
jgi:hypothetical protein